MHGDFSPILCQRHQNAGTELSLKNNFVIYIADRKATICLKAKLFLPAVLTLQHHHWYAAILDSPSPVGS